jgi:hypothetical protein
MTSTEYNRIWRKANAERWKASKRKARREYRRRLAAVVGWTAVNAGATWAQVKAGMVEPKTIASNQPSK